MKRVLLLSALFGLHIVLKAQKVYFIYLQSESSTPFYVKMAGKIQSSTAEGYLIIPKLTDSTYLVTIGQPGKQTEPRFSITISRNDRGFLIKDFDGTPGLFDLQTLAVYKPINSEPASAAQTVTKNDNFTRLLAKAADDSTLLSQPVVVQEQKPKPKEPKPDVIEVKQEVAVKRDTLQQSPPVALSANNLPPVTVVEKDTLESTKAVVAEAVKDTVVTIKQDVAAPPVEEEYKRSIVTKKSESSTSEGFGLVFTDAYNGMIDTVQLVIPNPRMVLPDTTQKQPSEARQFLDITTEKIDSSGKEVLEVKKDANVSEVIKDTAQVKAVQDMVKAKPKSQCQALSTDDDFFKLRRDMVAKNTDDEMITQAKKYFKAKCYRTEQIKYLSNLFLSDEGKYQFFDAAYQYVSDQERFASLQLELKDTYYLNRFKALIGN